MLRTKRALRKSLAKRIGLRFKETQDQSHFVWRFKDCLTYLYPRLYYPVPALRIVSETTK